MSILSDEELKYFKALQNVISKEMGQLIYNDRLCHLLHNDEVTFWKISGSGYYLVLNAKIESVAFSEEDFKNQFISIPLTIDNKNPKRGLWGMIDWSLFNKHLNDNGNLLLWTRDEKWYSKRHPPTLALLKSLAYQEGVEILE